MVAFRCLANGYDMCFNYNGTCVGGISCVGCHAGWHADNSLFRADNCTLPDGFYLAYMLFSILASGGFIAFFLHVLVKRKPRSNVWYLVIETLLVNLFGLCHAVSQYAEDGAYEATLVFYALLTGACVVWGATLSVTATRLVFTLRPPGEFLRLRRGMIAFYTLQFFGETTPALVAAGLARSPDVSAYNAAVVSIHYNIVIYSLICVVIFFYVSAGLMRKLNEAVEMKNAVGGSAQPSPREGTDTNSYVGKPRGGSFTSASGAPGGGGSGIATGGEGGGSVEKRVTTTTREAKMKDIMMRLNGMRQQYYGLISSLLLLLAWGTTQVTLGSFPYSWAMVAVCLGGMQLSIPLTTWEAVNKRTLDTGSGGGAGKGPSTGDASKDSSTAGGGKSGSRGVKPTAIVSSSDSFSASAVNNNNNNNNIV